MRFVDDASLGADKAAEPVLFSIASLLSQVAAGLQSYLSIN